MVGVAKMNANAEKGLYVTFAISLLIGSILALNLVGLKSSSGGLERFGSIALVDRVFDRFVNIRDAVDSIVRNELNLGVSIADDAVYFTEILPAEDVELEDLNTDLKRFADFANIYRDDLMVRIDTNSLAGGVIQVTPCDINHLLTSTGLTQNNGVSSQVGNPLCSELTGYHVNIDNRPSNYKDLDWVEQHLDPANGKLFRLHVERLGVPPVEYDENAGFGLKLDALNYRNLVVLRFAGQGLDSPFDLNISIGPNNDLNLVYGFVVDVNVVSGPKFNAGSDITINVPANSVRVEHVDSNISKTS